jgi:hypothetical protein
VLICIRIFIDFGIVCGISKAFGKDDELMENQKNQ